MKYAEKFCFSLILMVIAISAKSAETSIALTIDDVPAVGDIPTGVSRLQIAQKIISVLNKHGIGGVYGFVNASKLHEYPQGMEVLRAWIAAGHKVGNHSYSHPDLNKTSLADYQAEITKNEPLLEKLVEPKVFKIFRYPFLHEGNTQEKRDGVRQFLFARDYKIAQVTVDFSDWVWNTPVNRCLRKGDQKTLSWLRKTIRDEAVSNLRAGQILSEYLAGRQIRHIGLVHISYFVSEMLDEILTAWEQKGVKFVSLESAMADPIYQTNPNVVRDEPYTFLNQIRLAKGLKNPPEVQAIYEASPEAEVEQACI